MPLFSEHISNMYYSGTPSYSSPYSSYTRSPSPLGTSYSATYLNPGGSYSTHSSLSSYSRAPLTSRWISGLSRSYSPMLTPISERGTSSPVRINSPRRIPLSKRSYGTSGYTQRPININTADIDVSRDKYRRKSIEIPAAVSKPPPYKEPTNVEKEKSPFMPRVDGKPETGIDSSPGPQRNTIKRGRTVVRLHTIKRKERDSPRKAETVEPQNDVSDFVVNESETNESKSWREKLSEDLAYTEKKEKKTLGAKFVETFIVKDVRDQENKLVNNLRTELNCDSCDPPPLQPNDEFRPIPKSPDRRCSMELLAEQANVLDSLIRGENLSTATLDLSKIGVTEEPKPNAETIKKKKSAGKGNPLNKTKSDQSLHENLKLQRKSKDTNLFSKRRSLKKSSSGGSICRLDSITELPKDPMVLPDLPAIAENRKSIELDKGNVKPKPKLKAKITTSVEVSPPSSPLKFRIENVIVEEKIRLPKKEITFTSAVEDTTQDITIQSPLKRTNERRSVKIKSKKVDDPVSPEPDDGNFWNKIGKRETVYLIKRKQNLDDMKEKNKRAMFWFPEDKNEESELVENIENNDSAKSVILTDSITTSNTNPAVASPNFTQQQILTKDTDGKNIKIDVPASKSNNLQVNNSQEVLGETLQEKQVGEQNVQNILEQGDNTESLKRFGSTPDLKSKPVEIPSQSETETVSIECEIVKDVTNNELKEKPLKASEKINEINILKPLNELKDMTEEKLEQSNSIISNSDVIRSQNVSNTEQIVAEPKSVIFTPTLSKEIDYTTVTKITTAKTEEVTSLQKDIGSLQLKPDEELSPLLNPETKIQEDVSNTKNIAKAENATTQSNEHTQSDFVQHYEKPKAISLKIDGKKANINIRSSAKSQESNKCDANKDKTLESISKQDKNAIAFTETESKKLDKIIETKVNNALILPKKQNAGNKSEPKISNKITALKSNTAGIGVKLKETRVQKCPIHSVENKTDIKISNIANTNAATTDLLKSKELTEINDKPQKPEEPLVKTHEKSTIPAVISSNSTIENDTNNSVSQVNIVKKSENIPTVEAQSEASKIPTEVETKKTEDAKADNKTEEQANLIVKRVSVKTDTPLPTPPQKRPMKEEKALKPLIATPRPLQKRAPQIINSSESSESSTDESTDDEEESDTSEESAEFFECENNADGRTSTGSNDSGFDSSAPTSPASFMQIKKDCDVNCHRKCEKLTANLCGVNQRLLVEALATRTSSKKGADSPGPSSSNATSQLPATDILEQELEQSTAYGLFRKTGRFTPPARSIPRFRKYMIEDFQFIKVLGKGSFGKVLLAELRDTEYYYAVKCLKKDVVLEDDDVECTLIERKVLALGTNHPYLCHLFATFQTDSHLFFVMEYLNGGDLMFHIQQSGRFPEARARFYGAEIVSGLKFLHKRGIVYRDLKLDNILLDFDGHVRIADFGMCKLQIYLDKTADTFCGTPDYMAPEIIKGLKYNQTVDWWSFGVLLYEMLIGQSPFSGCDEDELFWSICNEMPSYPRFLSQESLTILTRLLDKDARSRLGGVECMHGDIREQDFFHHIHWDRLERRELEAPFRPRVRHPLDTQYFDRAFTGERPRLTAVEPHVLRSMDQEPFRGFSYTNPNATDR